MKIKIKRREDCDKAEVLLKTKGYETIGCWEIALLVKLFVELDREGILFYNDENVEEARKAWLKERGRD